jgi:hypothetical protein
VGYGSEGVQKDQTENSMVRIPFLLNLGQYNGMAVKWVRHRRLFTEHVLPQNLLFHCVLQLPYRIKSPSLSQQKAMHKNAHFLFLRKHHCNIFPADNLKKNLCGLSPQANYTDRATAAIGEVSADFCG